jgi:3-hydroxyisobutyrate dehydrogenase
VKLGFIGLGTMGGPMALNMRRAGYDLTVNDIRTEAGERHLELGCDWAPNPRAIAEASEVVFTSLPGPREVESVALAEDGLLAGMRPGTAWFDLSTNSPTLLRRLHGEFKARGIDLLDAPVSGGQRGAISGQLAVWVGGDREVFDRHRAALDAIGDQVMYVGPIGAGSIAKLTHNAASFAVHAALTEVFTMGVKAGLEPLPLWRAIRQGASGRRRTFDRLGDGVLQASFDPASFALKLAHKDLSLATQLGREMMVPMRIANLVLEEMTEALNRGWGDRDSRVTSLLQEERAGVEFHVSEEDVREVLAAG